MKKNEIIELNGKEYTVELNRESWVLIDKLVNIAKTYEIMHRGFYNYIDDQELDDNIDLDKMAEEVSQERLDEEIKTKRDTMRKAIERAFLIWLNPNHHLKPSEVKEILEPYLNDEDEEKTKFIWEKYGQFLEECVQIRMDYIEETKNLKAQVNK